MHSRFRVAVEQARKSGDLYFAGLLSKERITEAAAFLLSLRVNPCQRLARHREKENA